MKTTFEWSDDYLLGHAVLDKEHKYLFNIANRVLALHNAEGAKDTLQTLMFELYEYVKSHFEHEETFMRKIGYPELSTHQSIHSGIVKSITDILGQSKDLNDLDQNLKHLMEGWIVNHVKQQDMKIKSWQQSQTS